MLPFGPPGLDHDGVFFAPQRFQLVECRFRLAKRLGAVDPFQVNQERLVIFRGDVAQRVTDLVHDAELHFGIRINRGNRLRKARQAVDRGDQDVLDASILQVGQH